MMIYLGIATLIGIFGGIFTGLTPGIHTNLLSLVIISISNKFLFNINPLVLAVFVASMSVTHTFVDFIPSVYLGAPSEDTALSIMPGHEFLIQGRGHTAIKLTLLGSLSSIFLLIIIIPCFFLLVPHTIGVIERMMGWLLIWIAIFLLTSKKEKIPENLIIFFLAGFLGFQTLNLSVNQPLLPLLTGLFGTSTIIHSLNNKTKIRKQRIEKLEINKKTLFKPLLATTLISPVCSFLPGLGASQAAIIGSKIVGKLDRKQFLVLMGSINTLVLISSFFTYYLTNKIRTGTVSAISNLISFTPKTITVIMISIVISAIISTICTAYLSRKLANNFHKLNYKLISQVILVILVIITLIISGVGGLIILITATLLGLLCIYLEVRRSLLMGCLLVPTILFYLPF